MPRQPHEPRKRRTRQHVIADLSAHHVEGFVLAAGHTVQQFHRDYGYDLILFTYDERGYYEAGQVLIQLKAAEQLKAVGTDYVYDLDVRDYNLWHVEDQQVILILYDASRRRAYWLPVQQYFRDHPTRRPQKGAKWVRMRVPRRQVLSRRAIALFRELKKDFRWRVVGGDS